MYWKCRCSFFRVVWLERFLSTILYCTVLHTVLYSVLYYTIKMFNICKFCHPLVPSRITDNPNDTETQQDNSVSLYCQAEGIPLPTIIWYKEDTELLVSETVQISSISINQSTISSTVVLLNTSWSDSGSYHCVASNVLQSRDGDMAIANSTALIVVYCEF